MTTTPQAALLSDKEINARIRASEVHEYHPGAILELAREIEQDILSKLKPPPSILTNNELIDLAVEHGLGRKMPPLGLNTGNVFYTDNSYRTAALFDFADAHEAAILAKLQPAQEPVQAGELPDEREAFELELAKMPDWAPEFEKHRAWVEWLLWNFWQARAALAARKPLSVDEPQYRLLRSDVDQIEASDEFLSEDTKTWAIDPNGIFVGMVYGGRVLRPARRRINGIGLEVKT